MKNTLKVTNVMSDPTRFNIYQHLVEHHQDVSVTDISEAFDIHPNVARLHLSKLEEINLVTSYLKKTGKGVRPGRRYQLSNEVVELNFPARDYKILSSIALEALMDLGEPGKQALYETGKKYGTEVMHQDMKHLNEDADVKEKITVLERTGRMLGMYPSFKYDKETNSIHFSVNNCPFREIASNNHQLVCEMHRIFLKGMFEALFTSIELIEEKNMFADNCSNCAYIAKLSIV
ncbi:helix-turn-helix transcriptional regulator [Oceanobacillus alkalisoli]|uniref:helix-turn-helix transcriptional regulator n=1 Tax=Oceanobacillus alkalisoli TaxID=2925113 RepID=UPI001F11B340|nr:helix-turn-helix domain-containing protein [Oceanobacillus alkalisoli]MCF3941766.1 helix-turn-helix domain-containing protein [Oceanobacillus alkalisoli]